MELTPELREKVLESWKVVVGEGKLSHTMEQHIYLTIQMLEELKTLRGTVDTPVGICFYCGYVGADHSIDTHAFNQPLI